MKILFLVLFVFVALGFSQVKTEKLSSQDSLDISNIANQFNLIQKQLQQDELKVMADKSQLFDLQQQYNATLKAIGDKGKKK